MELLWWTPENLTNDKSTLVQIMTCGWVGGGGGGGWGGGGGGGGGGGQVRVVEWNVSESGGQRGRTHVLAEGIPMDG